MLDRLQKPFLTVETGEAYQPIRLTYTVSNGQDVIQSLEKLGCIQKNTIGNSWTWYWKGECDDIHFESIDSFRKSVERPSRLGTFTLSDSKLLLNLPSFKRACLAVPFFHRLIKPEQAVIQHADFINKVFGLDERLPHGFTELLKDEELDKILHQRLEDFHKIQEECEKASTAEVALHILDEHNKAELKKKLPYAERYIFDVLATVDPDVVFLAFYIYLRGRELVAVKRWYGQTGYSLLDATDEAVNEVFGEMGIDILE